MKYCSIDLETTGLNEDECQILEFGAVLEDTNNIKNIDLLPTFHAYIIPEKGKVQGDMFAINMNAKIISKIINKEHYPDDRFLKIDELADTFLFWLHQQGFELDVKNQNSNNEYKCVTINVAGKNFNGFDRKFLNKVPDFSKKIRMRTRVLDPAILMVDWTNDTTLPSLDECKRRANVIGPVTHLAVDDAKDVIEILRTKYSA